MFLLDHYRLPIFQYKHSTKWGKLQTLEGHTVWELQSHHSVASVCRALLLCSWLGFLTQTLAAVEPEDYQVQCSINLWSINKLRRRLQQSDKKRKKKFKKLLQLWQSAPQKGRVLWSPACDNSPDQDNIIIEINCKILEEVNKLDIQNYIWEKTSHFSRTNCFIW